MDMFTMIVLGLALLVFIEMGLSPFVQIALFAAVFAVVSLIGSAVWFGVRHDLYGITYEDRYITSIAIAGAFAGMAVGVLFVFFHIVKMWYTED